MWCAAVTGSYVAFNGKVYEKSLTGTCLGCHNKAEFCDRCHAYSGVSSPYCWNCHSEPAIDCQECAMRITRKDFLRLTGLSLLAAGCQAGRTMPLVSQHVARVRGGKTCALGNGDRSQEVPREGWLQRLHSCLQYSAQHSANRQSRARSEMDLDGAVCHCLSFCANRLRPAEASATIVPLMCNHCADPPCTRVCPTQATWKRSDGIVMMDWHRCIGCRYCIAACPYGSRSFNWQDPRQAIPSIIPISPRAPKAWWRNATSARSAWRAGKGRPASMPARGVSSRSATWRIRILNHAMLLRTRFALQREPELGTGPSVYYLV